MNGKYQPGQKVFLTGGNKNLIKEATVLKYTGGFYTIRFENGGGIKVRESRIYPTRKEAEAAILNRARNRNLSERMNSEKSKKMNIEYDKDGKVIRDETQDLSPGDGDTSHISEYEYDDEGLKTHETYSTRGSSEIYSYDIKSVKNGNVITEESYDKEGSLVSKNIYTYNSDDILLSVELEAFDNNGETSFYQKEEYDTKGNKTNVYTVYDKGESWYNNRIENYYEGDELVKQYEYFSNSFSDHEELSRQCLVKNSYDSDGKLIHTVFSNEESEDNTTESEVIYTYQE